MKTIRNILPIVGMILLVLLAVKCTSEHYEGQLETSLEANRVELIKSSQLKKINEGLYSKLVADTLKIGELNKLVDSLELEVKNPKIVTKLVFVPKEVEKPIDDIVVNDSTINIVDNYPNKDNPFVTYTAKVNRTTGKGIGKFVFTPQEFSLGIGLNEDGTYFINTKVPEFIEITGLDVEALPIKSVEVDNFGWVTGVGLGKNYNLEKNFISLYGGLRYKKFYIGVQATTIGSIQGDIKIEF